MKFSDIGIIISQKNYGENSLIVKVFSQNHGIYRGFVKSIKSSKAKTIYQVGNLISFDYISRLEDNLGQFVAVDLVKSYLTKIIFDKAKLDCASSLFSIIDGCFLERESFAELFLEVEKFFVELIKDETQSNNFLGDYIKLELKILENLGYGIDLSTCVVSGLTTNLVFVSPKSAKAVSLEASKGYEDKLLKLPKFLLEENVEICKNQLLQGLDLSGFFINKLFDLPANQGYFFHRNSIKRSLQAIEK